MAKGLEFVVTDWSGQGPSFKTFDAACGHAVSLAVRTGDAYNVDVMCWTRAAARTWAGDAGVEQFDADPETGRFARIVVRATQSRRSF